MGGWQSGNGMSPWPAMAMGGGGGPLQDRQPVTRTLSDGSVRVCELGLNANGKNQKIPPAQNPQAWTNQKLVL
jgi:hypothetical protein